MQADAQKPKAKKNAPKPKEETKDERPQTAQKRGGQPGQAARGSERGGRGRGGKREEGQNRPREQDKNSWAYKYYHEERPKYERTKVTMETEIEPLPAKDEILKNPKKETFDAAMAKIDADVTELRNKQKGLHQKRREVIDGGKMSGSSMTYREALTGKINGLRSINAKKRAHQNQMSEYSEALDQLEAEKRQLQKSMHGDYKTAEDVSNAIKSLEYKQKTSSFKSAVDEKKLIQEIEQLKASVPKAKRYSEIKPLT